MKGVEIVNIQMIHRDERGETYECDIRETKNLIIGYRKRGSISGQHFHKGEEKSKSPEIFLLVMGKIRFIAENLDGEKDEMIISSPAKVIIEPYVYHEFHSLEDTIFIEIKPQHDEYRDKYGKEDFLRIRERK